MTRATVGRSTDSVTILFRSLPYSVSSSLPPLKTDLYLCVLLLQHKQHLRLNGRVYREMQKQNTKCSSIIGTPLRVTPNR